MTYPAGGKRRLERKSREAERSEEKRMQHKKHALDIIMQVIVRENNPAIDRVLSRPELY